jgi:hypothetical protein
LLDRLFAVEQLLSPVRRTTSTLISSGTRPKPVPLRALQRSLRPDELVLEYVLSEPQSYSLTISREEIRVVALPIGKQRIESLVDGYLAAVRSRVSDAEVANELFRLVLELTLGSKRQSRLVVIPRREAAPVAVRRLTRFIGPVRP